MKINNNKIIAPSILSSDLSNLTQQIRMTEIGGANWIHCDVMDGHFVPNLTFGPTIIKAAKKSTSLIIDAHLMIENPDLYLEDFCKAGADYITVHQESCNHLDRTINKIKQLGIKAGVAINPATPLSTLTEILSEIDLLLIMSVNPGFGGQSFIFNSLNKIKQAYQIRKDKKYSYLIEVDGGINKNTIRDVNAAGCDVFVAGSSIFNSENITASVTDFRNILSEKV